MSQKLNQDVKAIVSALSNLKGDFPITFNIIGEINFGSQDYREQAGISIKTLETPKLHGFQDIESLVLPKMQNRIETLFNLLPEPKIKYLLGLALVIAHKKYTRQADIANFLGVSTDVVGTWERQLKEIFGKDVFD